MASVSIAARDSLRVSTVCLVSSQDRSSAVRNVHFLPILTSVTPRLAYSALRRARASFRSTPFGKWRDSVASSIGSREANSSASSSRNSSARAAGCSRAGAGSLLCTTLSFFAALGIDFFSLCVFLRVMRGASVRTHTLAHIDGRERLFLMDFSDALAHQFERGGKRRRKHRRRERRLHDVLNQILIEARPIRRLPDQAVKRRARFGKR